MKSFNRPYKIEVCVETLEEALEAQRKGADQIELCSRLDLDGLTPSRDLIQACMIHLDIPVKVMIRPRAGNFLYTDDELAQMSETIMTVKQMGITEVVFGVITANNQLDISAIQDLVGLAKPMKVTIHKAIDVTTDLIQEVKNLLAIDGVKSILSSGGAKTAAEGRIVLAEMKRIANGRIEIIGAGKILPENIDLLHAKIGLSTYHGKNILERS